MVVPAVVAVRVVAIFSTCRAFVSCRVSVCGDGLAVRICGDLVAFVVRGVHLVGFPFFWCALSPRQGKLVGVTFPAGWGQKKRDAKFSQDFALWARPGPSDSTLRGGEGVGKPGSWSARRPKSHVGAIFRPVARPSVFWRSLPARAVKGLWWRISGLGVADEFMGL